MVLRWDSLSLVVPDSEKQESRTAFQAFVEAFRRPPPHIIVGLGKRFGVYSEPAQTSMVSSELMCHDNVTPSQARGCRFVLDVCSRGASCRPFHMDEWTVEHVYRNGCCLREALFVCSPLQRSSWECVVCKYTVQCLAGGKALTLSNLN